MARSGPGLGRALVPQTIPCGTAPARFASPAAIAYAAAQQQAKMVRTVATRQLIGRAEGILMERHKITGDQAFALLVRASQQSHLKLRDVADRLIHSGDLGGQA